MSEAGKAYANFENYPQCNACKLAKKNGTPCPERTGTGHRLELQLKSQHVVGSFGRTRVVTTICGCKRCMA